MRGLLRPSGLIFFGFPPWCMPFGGHQQMCRSKLLSRTPYFHLLPTKAYEKVLRAFGEPDGKVKGLLRHKETGISVARFERTAVEAGYRVAQRRFYLLNPVYQLRFGVPVTKQLAPLSAIPHLRDFVSTCAYYVLEPVAA
jgi:hypothetical protein